MGPLPCSYPVPAANLPLAWENSVCPSSTIGMRLVHALKGCREMHPCFSHEALVAGPCLPAGTSVGENNPQCPGHLGQVGGRVRFGFSAEIPAEISSVPRFPHLCVGTVSFPGVELGLLGALLGGGQAVSTWGCVSSCRLRKNPTQYIKFLPGDLFFALLLKLVSMFSLLCPFPSS